MAHTFERPYRPLGIRAYNWLGATLGFQGVSLEPEAVIKAAQKRTGLTDFGDYSFREPFDILMESLQKDARLNTFGRVFCRLNAYTLLCNRLRLQDLRTKHPEMLERPVRQPLIVVGLPRTGTTLLYNLLAQDPECAPLMTWEMMYPCRWKEKDIFGRDPRIGRTRRVVYGLDKLSPALKTIHKIDPDGPEECSRLLANTLVTAYYLLENDVPTYEAWLNQQPTELVDAAYQDFYEQMQAVCWQRKGDGYWMSKSPAHIFAMDSLLRKVPDVRIVQTHRDPTQVIASCCSLFAVYRGIMTDRIDTSQLGRSVADLLANGLARGMKAREGAQSDRLTDVRYQDLVANPLGTLERIYSDLGLTLSAEHRTRAEQWLADHPQNKHGRHKYTLEQFGLDKPGIEDQFSEYCQTYELHGTAKTENSPAA